MVVSATGFFEESIHFLEEKKIAEFNELEACG